jgi:hypothetical protein
MIDNNIHLMVRGHEICRGKSACKNADVVLSLAYGHNMHPDESVFITTPIMGAK